MNVQERIERIIEKAQIPVPKRTATRKSIAQLVTGTVAERDRLWSRREKIRIGMTRANIDKKLYDELQKELAEIAEKLGQ